MSLVVVDACGANISSVLSALDRLGGNPQVSADPDIIKSADRVILPGVGAAGSAMQRLQQAGLDQLIPSLTQPVLGICVGMQVLFQGSEEDNCKCLGIVPAGLKHIPSSDAHPVPHMGWNQLNFLSANEGETNHSDLVHPLLDNLGEEAWCYFVHSYAAPVIDSTIASCDYSTSFTAAVAYNNFYGVQFHPERSGKTGAQVLHNFLNMVS